MSHAPVVFYFSFTADLGSSTGAGAGLPSSGSVLEPPFGDPSADQVPSCTPTLPPVYPEVSQEHTIAQEMDRAQQNAVFFGVACTDWKVVPPAVLDYASSGMTVTLYT